MVYLWNTVTGQRHATLEGHQNQVRICVFSHGGDLLATYGWDGMTRLWDPVSGKPLVSLPGAAQSFSRDDRWLGYAQLGTEVGLWEVAPGRECRTLYAYGQPEVLSVAISPHGRLLVSGHADGVRLWDLAADRLLAYLPTPGGQAFFGPTGDALFTCGRYGIHRWPIAPDGPDGLRVGPPTAVSRSPAGLRLGASLSRDGRWLATPIGRWEAQVIDLDNPAASVRLGQHRARDAITISPDGRWAVTTTQHGSQIKVWDARESRLVKDIPAGAYSGAAFSPDGRWLVTTSLETPRQTWDVGTWEEVRYEKRHGGGVFSKEGGLLALTHRAGSMVLHHGLELVDAATGDDLATLAAPNQLSVGGIAFSPDGSQLAVTEYGRIWVWDLRAVRRELSAIGLDWDRPPYAPLKPGRAPKTWRVEVELGELADRAKGQPHLAEPLNNEAWRLATAPDPKDRNPAKAVELARKAVDLDPYSGIVINTLGVAHFRAGDWPATIAALEKSIALRGGGDSFDWFFLAMAHWKLGDKEQARKRFDQAVRWMEANEPTNEELRRFRAEAEALIGPPDSKQSEPKL
jgi:WD40 repeat protein